MEATYIWPPLAERDLSPQVPGAFIKHSSNYGFVGLDVQGDGALSRTRSGTLNKTSSELLDGEDGAADAADAAVAGVPGVALELSEMRHTPHAFSYFTVRLPLPPALQTPLGGSSSPAATAWVAFARACGLSDGQRRRSGTTPRARRWWWTCK